MNKLTWKGTGAELRYGYHLAARLGVWTIESGCLAAAVLEVTNAILLTQPGLTFHRPGGKPRQLQRVQLADGRITAKLTPAEVIPHAHAASGNHAA